MLLSYTKLRIFTLSTSANKLPTMQPRIQFTAASFHDIPVETWYKISQLRVEVFIVEQQCIYQEFDGKDLSCTHIYGCFDNKLVASARLVPPGISYEGYCSIGRVVSDAEYRRHGFGFELLQESVRLCEALYPGTPIKISAQVYLIKFYEKFGFRAIGEHYLEDGLPHVAMVRPVH
jgi:ElaA protein